jgi:hypothetical protein
MKSSQRAAIRYSKRFYHQGVNVYDRDYVGTGLSVICIARSVHAAEHIEHALNARVLDKKLGKKKVGGEESDGD